MLSHFRDKCDVNEINIGLVSLKYLARQKRNLIINHKLRQKKMPRGSLQQPHTVICREMQGMQQQIIGVTMETRYIGGCNTLSVD